MTFRERIIVGSRGVVTFGGVAAVVGEVTEVGEDYLTLVGRVSGTRVKDDTEVFLVPFSAVAYFRLDTVPE